MESLNVAKTTGRSPAAATGRPRGGKRAAVRWTTAPGWDAIVAGETAPNWFDLANDPAAESVKANALRRVWLVTCGGRRLYVKEYLHDSTSARLRHLIRGPDARIEWRAGRAAAGRGVPCVKMVACGVSRDRSFLATEAVAGAVPLADAWRRARDAGSETDLLALIRATARLLARAHASGFVHGDDHPSNILIATDRDGARRALYVDIARARVSDHLADRVAAASLGQLNQWFRLRAGRRRRLRFLWTYCLERAGADRRSAASLVRRLGATVFVSTHTHAAKLWDKRDGRILGRNAYFDRITLADRSRAHVTLRFRQRDLFPSPSLPDQTGDAWKARLDAGDGKCGRDPDPNVRVRTASPPHGIVERVKRRWAGSPTRRTFRMGHRLRNRDLPCRWSFAWIRESNSRPETVWMDAHPRTEPLMRRLAAQATPVAARRRLAQTVADVVRLMSDRGAALVVGCKDALGVALSGGEVIIDDPTAVVLRARDPDRDILATSLALYVEARRDNNCFRRTDAARFLKSLSPRGWKTLWRDVAAAEGRS